MRLKHVGNFLAEVEKVEEGPPKPPSSEDPALDYEEWKRKILENAARAQEAGAE